MSWLYWSAGKAGGGYQKMTILAVPAFFELSLVRIREGEEMSWHRDPHSVCFRDTVIAWTVKKAKKGGQVMTKLLVLDGEKRGAVKLTIRHKGRLSKWHPDVTEHAISKVEEGSAVIVHFLWTARITASFGPR